MKVFDLNAAAPEEVAKILREAAQAYNESSNDLQAAWGDPQAGKVWEKLAAILERAADSCDNAVARHFK